jgi:hypothetical protein
VAHEATPAGVSVLFWLVQGLVIVAVVCLATGAMLPWLRVTGSLTENLAPQVQGILNIIASLSGQESLLGVEKEIHGLEGYGKLTLGIAAIGVIVLIADIFVIRKSSVPGVVYLLLGLVAAGAIGIDLVNYYRIYQEAREFSILFGVQFSEVIEFFDQWIDLDVTILIGLPLTGAGLALLLVGGIGRLVVPLLQQGGRD